MRIVLVLAQAVVLVAGIVISVTGSPWGPRGVSRDGRFLTLDGAHHDFGGVDAYELATDYTTNDGCGFAPSARQVDGLFAALPPHSLVRFWAFQAMAVSPATGRFDFRGLDRVFAAAARHGDYLIATLTDQAGTCDGGAWRSPAWYAGGYRSIDEADGRQVNVEPYAAWVVTAVTRYRSSPALGIWELVNEPETSACEPGFTGSACFGHTTCDPATSATLLHRFFDTEGAVVHRLDRRHLLAAGLTGTGQCGTAGPQYRYVGGSREIDVLTIHDYDVGAAADPSLEADLAAARALDKPLLTEETGTQAGPAPGCTGLAARAQVLRRERLSQEAAGVRGFLVWNWLPYPVAGCALDVTPGDPSLSLATLG